MVRTARRVTSRAGNYLAPYVTPIVSTAAGEITRRATSSAYDAANRQVQRLRKNVNRATTRQTGNRYTYQSRTGATTRLATKKSKLKRVTKKRKNTYVPKKFRKRVKEVLHDNEAKYAGSYSCYDAPLVYRPEYNNLKDFVAYPHYTKAAGTLFNNYQMGEVFSPNLVLDAASKMYKISLLVNQLLGLTLQILLLLNLIVM